MYVLKVDGKYHRFVHSKHWSTGDLMWTDGSGNWYRSFEEVKSLYDDNYFLQKRGAKLEWFTVELIPYAP